VERAKAGVRVLFLYDEVGSLGLSDGYLEQMRQAGVLVSGFKTTRGRGNRFQVNFRNHRKLIVADGHTGFIGGLNLGDEYYKYRDTHLRIRGPAAQHILYSFSQDWYWATGQLPGLKHSLPETPGSQAVAIASTGPADPEPRCSVLFVTLINMAQRRLWIASPYFVPDEACVRALQAAALRGVDVRVLIPDQADKRAVELASFTYYTEMLDTGVQLFRFRDRFMHQKVILVDDTVAGVGTVNLDNRSLYLNFESTALVADPGFVGEIDTMLSRDLERSNPVGREQYCDRSLGFRFLARLARLAAPLL
jgi:cardiolipin synthase